MKKYLLLLALLPLFVTAQSTQRIEADNILLQTRTPQISNANVTVNGSIKITAVANGSSTDSVLVVANGTLKRIARSAFSEFVSKTNADTITAFKWFTRKVILDSMYGTIYNGILNNALVKYNIGFVRPEGGTVTSYLAASTSSFGGPRNYHLPSRYANDTLLCQGDSNLYATKSDIIGFPTTSSVNAALALKQNTLTLTTTGSGAATLNGSTGALNIPVSSGGTPAGTYAQRIALTPTTGQQFYQTDIFSGVYEYNGRFWQRNKTGKVIDYDFLQNQTLAQEGLTNNQSGTGAGLDNGTNTLSSSNLFGVRSISTGTTTSGFANITTAASLGGGSNVWSTVVDVNSRYWQEYNVSFSAIPNLTENFIGKIGALNGATTTTLTQDIGFVFDNSGFVKLTYYDLSGIQQTVTTDVVFSANTFYTLAIEQTFSTPGSGGFMDHAVKFYINNVLKGTYTCNRPNAFPARPLAALIIKTAGTTAVRMFIDYIKMYQL